MKKLGELIGQPDQTTETHPSKEERVTPLKELSIIPEGTRLNPEQQERIKTGVTEIHKRLHQPLEAAQNHLNKLKSPLEAEAYQQFKEPAEQLEAAYQFFDSFLAALSSPQEWEHFPPLQLELRLTRNETGLQQVDFIFTSREPMGRLGTQEADSVYAVELEFILQPAKEDSYTHQSIKFRARGVKNEQGDQPELACLRTDIHYDPKAQGRKLRPIQVDITTPWDVYSRKHLGVEAFGENSTEAAARFREAQHILLHNITQHLIECALTEPSSIAGTDKNNLTFKQQVPELHSQAARFLGISGKPDRLKHYAREKYRREQKQEQKSRLAKIEKFNEAVIDNVSPYVADTLRKLLQAVLNNQYPEKELSDAELLLYALSRKDLDALVGGTSVPKLPKITQALEKLKETSPISLSEESNREKLPLFAILQDELLKQAEDSLDQQEGSGQYQQIMHAVEEVERLAAIASELQENPKET
ncbi:hypothetical protein B5M47_03520 [candidate division CPR3 bacterium 4484_211]|uniref:Uncharacterized protein n=1 Tax=candidate division CPR3 bacterium 4484_211 TaxID=1968527 RepID=A0A1W9NWZ7_UNCC3|nr:MAG: hypothetical protein B5M47_03520 [candidate division CPR3 bacterium 4484_211]